jgi:lipoate-protein ligase A
MPAAVDSVAEQLDCDNAMLEEAERGGPARFRVWTTAKPTVVLGRSVDVRDEVDEDFCAGNGVAVVRRTSGGRSVLVGRGPVQDTFALPYSLAEELSAIPGSQRFSTRLLLVGLRSAAGPAARELREDASGDLVCEGRKVAGLALRRRRAAMMLHGTILVRADLALVARTLKHPLSEPAYRAGRRHAEFLANRGALAESELERIVTGHLASL